MAQKVREASIAASRPSSSPVAQPNGREATRRSRLSPTLTVALCVVAIAAAGARLWLLSPWYQERRLSHLPLPQLLREVRTGRNNPTLLYYAGLRLVQQGHYAAADPLLERAVGLDPDSPRLRDAWARALLGSGMTTAAHGELRDFAQRHPELAAAHDLLGKFYFTQRSMQRAEAEFRKAVARDSRDLSAWEYLSQAADVQDEAAQAQQAAERAVALRPNSATDHVLLASVLLHSNRSFDARREYARAVALDPHIGVAHRDYAIALLNTSAGAADWNLAAQQAQQAISLDGNDPRAWLALGRARMYRGQLQQAEAPLLQAIRLEKDDPAPALTLAQLYHKLGQPTQYERWEQEYLQRQSYRVQRQAMEAAVSAHPTSRPMQQQLARLLGLHGDVEGSARHYAVALRHPLDSPPVLAAAARDLTAGGHADLALPLAQRAVAVANKNPTAHLALGEALFALGRDAEGLNEYQRAVNIAPELHPELVQRLKRLMATRKTRVEN